MRNSCQWDCLLYNKKGKPDCAGISSPSPEPVTWSLTVSMCALQPLVEPCTEFIKLKIETVCFPAHQASYFCHCCYFSRWLGSSCRGGCWFNKKVQVVNAEWRSPIAFPSRSARRQARWHWLGECCRDVAVQEKNTPVKYLIGILHFQSQMLS